MIMSRPRGYFGLPRDVVLLDGKEPTDVKPGVPTDSATTLRLPARRPAAPWQRCSTRSGSWPGLAGVGKQDCGRRIDLLAVLAAARLRCAPICRSESRGAVSIAEAYDMPVARSRWCRRARRARRDNMTAFGRMAAMRKSPIAPGASAPMKRISSRAASSAAAASSSTRRMRSGMCWSTITRTTRGRRPASGCCGRCSAKGC